MCTDFIKYDYFQCVNGYLHGAAYFIFIASIGVNLSYIPKLCMFLYGAAYYHESSGLVDTNTRIGLTAPCKNHT